MTTSELIEQTEAGIRARGIDYLLELAADDPTAFLRLVAWIAEESGTGRTTATPTGPVQFVITQQPGSHNRT